MSKNETVTLKIKPGANAGNGWTQTTASNGQSYLFKYSGGENDNGGLKTKVGDGQATIALTLDTDNRYSINSMNFYQDTQHQLSWLPTAGSQSSGTITDLNSQPENTDYIAVVIDAQANNATIYCDPMIQNEPRGPMPMPRIMHASQ
jgi:hypothetical protein